MGRKDPRSSMSKSVKGKSPMNPTGRNPFESGSPYETPGVGEGCTPKGPSLKQGPETEPVDDSSTDRSAEP